MCAFSFFKKKKSPHIVESPKPPTMGQGAGMNFPEYKSKPYYIVASVEMGNTTTKCILIGTNLETGRSYIINKTVSMSRDVRPPKPGEEIFGETLVGTPITRESVTDLVKDTLIRCHKEAGLSIKEDLDFVVRSTGVVAAMDSPDQVGDFVIALANGCLEAGVPPKKMTPPMGIDNLPPRLRKFSFADKLTFCGTVAGVSPPIGSSGVEMVANEMEGELAMAGIKEGAKWTEVDFRNPCISIDFGTTLDGRITSDVAANAEYPFAMTIGNFCGLAGAIPDAIVRGTGKVNDHTGTALDLFGDKSIKCALSKKKNTIVSDYEEMIHDIIDIRIVPPERERFGKVPVRADIAMESKIAMIGCDAGENFSMADRLKEIGSEIYTKHNSCILTEVVDHVCANMALRLIDVAAENKLVPENSSIGFTGRAAISGKKPQIIMDGIEERGIYSDPYDHVLFVDDGLARGAALMGRCMSSIGKPNNPMGGVRGGPCIMKRRMKIGK
ncbi:methanogenesis marker 14 protein [Methanoplanus endosymbiosus]|uniref:Methanogenesis marker 14 protein n=1 Tax=Methanoplanus endosymbiosus TaxID=33865 RepID=A0A9E7PLF3_9EURY|nr:methanogenesis marker 14 protein [Methanoplanus endosymbiosus]UUX92333.1 methanogenesis marker 14 protein [Methanoplanus endosymbiosus]